MFWVLFFALFLSWTCFVQWRKRRLYELARQLKNGLRSWPVIGHALFLMGDDEDRMSAIKLIGEEALKYGGMTAAWLGHRLYIIIADPEAAECTTRTFLDKDDVVRLSKFITGNGSIFAPEKIWRPRRKVLAPTFNHRNLTRYVNIFAKNSDIMVHQLKSKVDKGPFPIWNYITAYTMDSICETTLGVQLHSQKNPNQPFLKSFEQYCNLITKRMCRPWLHSDFTYQLHPDFKTLIAARDCMTGFIKGIINSKHEELKEDTRKDANNNTKTFVDLLLSSETGNKGFTDLELQEESLVLVMAGTDTSAVGIAFTAVMLSWYPDIQEKVYDELKDVFGDSKRLVEAEDLPRLKYLEAVIKETLRLYPPVPVTTRNVTSDLTLPSGLTLIKGCGAVINIWALHRNQKYWGADADQFNPGRFLGGQLKHPAQFATFGLGARSCVGYQYAMMSTKTALATILRHYKIVPATRHVSFTGGRPEYKPLRMKFGIMMKDVDDFVVGLIERE